MCERDRFWVISRSLLNIKKSMTAILTSQAKFGRLAFRRKFTIEKTVTKAWKNFSPPVIFI